MTDKIKDIYKIAYSYEATVNHTYTVATEMIKKYAQGCFVECGVGAGAQIAAMQLACFNAGSWAMGAYKKIWAFDSYQGIPLAGPNDAEQPGIGAITHDVDLPLKDRLCSSGQTVHTVNQVRDNLSRMGLLRDNIAFVEGWFQDTLPFYAKSTGPIALLRLDGDLYESTMCCLEELYPNVEIGGMVIIDDYALAGCRKAVEEYFTAKDGKIPAFQEVVGGHGPVFFYR